MPCSLKPQVSAHYFSIGSHLYHSKLMFINELILPSLYLLLNWLIQQEVAVSFSYSNSNDFIKLIVSSIACLRYYLVSIVRYNLGPLITPLCSRQCNFYLWCLLRCDCSLVSTGITKQSKPEVHFHFLSFLFSSLLELNYQVTILPHRLINCIFMLLFVSTL